MGAARCLADSHRRVLCSRFHGAPSRPLMTFPAGQPHQSPDPAARDRRELEWLERIRTGDEQAFEALFRAYVEPLCAFAYSYVESEPAAQEIVQDLFARLWERRGSGAGARHGRGYSDGASGN